MVEPGFPLAEGEKVVRESAEHHLLRPDASLVARLCHPFLTTTRLVLCEADYDLLEGRELRVGPVMHEVPLSAIQAMKAGADHAEPNIEIDAREPGKGLSKLILYFRDRGWPLGRPERLGERDEWITGISASRDALGLPRLAVPTRPPEAAPATAATTPDKHAPGVILGGKYEIVKHIGSGGMALVYEGLDKTLERPVAIKMMRPEVGMAGRDKTIFLREAKTSAALHHPFITDIYEVLDEAEAIYLIFEFVDGQTLQERMDDKGPFKPQALKPLLREICEALSYAHSMKYAHRDLKPSNIMVTKQGHAKVMDFGIARVLKDTASRNTKLDTSGTMPYMAPEQELGKGDFRCDIFSLGVTAYELLTGELPYRGPNFYLQKEKKDRKALCDACGEAPAELVAAIDRCLEFDPKDRFQTIAEFAASAGLS